MTMPTVTATDIGVESSVYFDWLGFFLFVFLNVCVFYLGYHFGKRKIND